MTEPGNDRDSAEHETSEVELRTVPNVRENADANTFVKDYLAWVDDSDDISQELVERQYADVRQTAMQRGLRPTGDPSLIEQTVINKHNVRLVYSVAVVVATIDAEREQGTKEAVASEQTATGEPVDPKVGNGAATTADGTTVDTTDQVPPTTGAPTPTNEGVKPSDAARLKTTTTASTAKSAASAKQSPATATTTDDAPATKES